MYINFEDKNNKCLFSVYLNSKNEIPYLFNWICLEWKGVVDFTLSRKPYAHVEIFDKKYWYVGDAE